MKLSHALSMLASFLLAFLAAAQETSTAAPRIYSSEYTISFPLTSTFTVIPPSSTTSSTASESTTSTTSESSVATTAAPTNAHGDIAPIISISSLPSLQVATVTDIWWSPVVGQGGPGISTEIPPRPWGKYDKVVVAHAVVGSVAWLIISPLAIILARLSKSPTASPATFSAHKWLQSILTFLLTLVAVILGGIATNVDGMPGRGHFRSAHQRMGLVLLLLLVLQILLGRWVSKHGHRGYTSLGSALHITAGVALTAIGFAQIYLGFSLYERRASRKVPVAVKVIWAVIVGLFSIYLIALALKTQFSKRADRSSPKYKRQRKAAIYGSGQQSPLGSPSHEGLSSWDFITGGPSSPGLATSRRPNSPEMRQTSPPPPNPLFSAVPVRGRQPSFEAAASSPSRTITNSPMPFTGLTAFADSPFSDSHAITAPAAAHFSQRPPMSQSPGTALPLSLPVVNRAPLVSGPAEASTSLRPIDEEAAVETGASVSGYTASTNESSYRSKQQQRARASTTGIDIEQSADPVNLQESDAQDSGETSGSSREDLLHNTAMRESASSPVMGRNADGRRSVSSIRRKAVPPLLQ